MEERSRPNNQVHIHVSRRMRLIASFVSLAINRFDSGSLSLCSVLDIGGRDSARETVVENSYLRHRGDPLEPLQKVITQTISEKTFLKSRTILRRCFVRGFRGERGADARPGRNRRTNEGNEKLRVGR